MRRLVVEERNAAVVVDEARTEAPVQDLPLRARLAAYVALTKPRIIELLLVTTIPAMIVAERGLPSVWLMLATLVGGTLGAGGANAINCYVDRDIDEVMHRTRKRPLPQHKVAPRNALWFGAALGLVSFSFMWATINLLSAALTAGALLFYVFVYTMWLKRSTPQNIVIGGAAGAIPAVVGWSAVTNTIELPALAMFAIIFYWTPPHFWALSMRYEKEYRAADVPMMPVVYGKEETSKHILLYSFLSFAMCLALFSVAKLGWIYLTVALVLNAIFIGLALQLRKTPQVRIAWDLFRFSIYYLAILFAAMAADVLFLN
jgi:heme o synthase